MYYSKCDGRWTGKGFAIVEIIVLVVVIILVVALIMPVLRYVRDIYHQMACGANLACITFTMLTYANDYDNGLPRAGGKDTQWGPSIQWNAADRFQAYNLQSDGSGGEATISSSFYLLVKYTEATPKLFICKGDSGTKEFKLSDNPISGGKKLTDFWDFGPNPQKHFSYSYHIPYGLYPLTKSCEPEMAIAADRNPWIKSPASYAKTPFTNFKPDIPPWNGTRKQAKFGNTVAHKEDGQNVLFMNSHVDFEKRPYCGIDDDNIYTFVSGGVGYPQIGTPPFPFESQPGSRKDSLLVHDPPATTAK
jgi:hypothetical protein